MYQRVLYVLAYASDRVKAKSEIAGAHAKCARCGAEVEAEKYFQKRYADKRNIKAGRVVPDAGLSKKNIEVANNLPKMSLLNRCVEDGICPFTNGILTRTGAFYRLIHKRTEIDQSVLVKEDDSLDWIEDELETSFDVIAMVENDFWIAYGCETCWGSEGAVYVFDKQKSRFVWLMMLENGNPFDKLHFEEDTLITTDSAARFEEGWIIPINKPWEISYWKNTQP